MFSPNDMRLWLVVCKDQLPEINHAQAVIDDSQMTNDIAGLSYTKNLLLYGVLPDYASDTRNDDALMMQSGFDFLVLKKSQHSNLNLSMLMDDMQECFLAVRKLMALIVEESRNPSNCESLYFLDENSFLIVPVWGKAGTNGYMLSLNLRSPE
jgi:hypothetical protein